MDIGYAAWTMMITGGVGAFGIMAMLMNIAMRFGRMEARITAIEKNLERMSSQKGSR